MSVPAEFHSTLCGAYDHTLCISVRQPITEVKAEGNVAVDVWEIGFYLDWIGNLGNTNGKVHGSALLLLHVG